MVNMSKIAVYGKGGIGKSTISANLSVAMATAGHKVLQIGCDPKHDSTKLLLSGQKLRTVLDYMRETGPLEQKVKDILGIGYLGIGCIEAGGPKPGVGCAGRGIISTFELLERFGLPKRYDTVVYDVLGDVVCGGFAVPIRREYADKILVVTSGEFMSLYAANNILKGIQNYDGEHKRVLGLVFNKRNVEGEELRVRNFAEAVKLPIVATVPRSDTFARAEALGVTAYQLGENPRLMEIFNNLARQVEETTEKCLYRALPISDEELEACLLNNKMGSTIEFKKDELSKLPEKDKDVEEEKEEKIGKIGNADTKVDVNLDSHSSDEATSLNDDQSPMDKSVYYFSKSLKNSEPLHGCAFNGGLSTSVHLKGAVVLAHSPKSCIYISHQTISSSGRRRLFEKGTLLPISLAPALECTNMGESEIVFGGMDTLIEKIETIKQQRKPKAIIVVSSCPAGIIGDDINQVAKLSDETTKVIPLRTDGNMSGDYMQGMIMAYTTLAKAFIDENVQQDEGYVNILAEKIVVTNTEENFQTISKYLTALGLKVNCRFLYDTDINALSNFKKAGLNLLAYGDYTGNMLAQYFQKEYQSKIFQRPFPVGFDNTCKWIRALAAKVHQVEAGEALIEGETKKYNDKIAKLRPYLKGKKLMVITYNHELDWILKIAIDAGMEIVKIGILSFCQDEGFRSELDLKCPIEVDYERSNRAEDVDLYKPDVLLTNYSSSVADKVPVADIIPMCPDVGFEAGINIGERWAQLLKLNRKGDWTNDEKLFQKYYGR